MKRERPQPPPCGQREAGLGRPDRLSDCRRPSRETVNGVGVLESGFPIAPSRAPDEQVIRATRGVLHLWLRAGLLPL